MCRLLSTCTAGNIETMDLYVLLLHRPDIRFLKLVTSKLQRALCIPFS